MTSYLTTSMWPLIVQRVPHAPDCLNSAAHSLRALNVDVLVSEPPYVGVRSPSAVPIPLGSVLIASLQAGATSLADVGAVLRSAPWCSVCLVDVTPPFDQRVIRAFEPHPGAFGLIRTGQVRSLPRHQMLGAVRKRPFPSPGDLARFVARRVSRLDLIPALSSCFEVQQPGEHIPRPPHRSTLSRHLQDFKPFTARDWAALARLSRVLELAGSRRWSSQERAALEHGIDGRTLRGWLVRFLGLSFGEALELVGWEWVVEAGLREGGYIARRDAQTGSAPQRILAS